MATYENYLTLANSGNTTIYEPSNGYSGDYTMCCGNSSNGAAYYTLLKLPDDLPVDAAVSSASLRLAESDTDNRGAGSLTMKISRVTGAWNGDTIWTTVPAYESAVHCDFVLDNSNNPDSSNYNGRRTRYKYRVDSDGSAPSYVYYSSYQGSWTYYDDWEAEYVGKVYDNYWCWHDIDITVVIQNCINSGCTGLILWFDLPGTNSTKKYFWNHNNTSTNYQPLLTIEYTLLPAPTEPVLDTISTVKDNSHTFGWSDASDNGGIYTSSQMSYDMQISTDNGAAWGGPTLNEQGLYVFASGQGSSELTVNLPAFLSLLSGQYYYNSQVMIRVRTKTPSYNGTVYYSYWTTSTAFTIDYRVTPTAPALSVNNASPYEGQAVVFTAGRPSSYNTYTSAGAGNAITYYVKLTDGTVLASGNAAVTVGTRSISYTVENLTTGISDLSANAVCYGVDSDSLKSPDSGNLAFTIKRFRAPVINIKSVTRTATAATVNFVIQDTGYGGTQSNSQINAVKYDIGSGYVTAALGSWSGLSNSFTVTGLAAGTRYSMNAVAENNAPPGLSNLTSGAFASTILEYTPIFAITNKKAAAKTLYVGADFSIQPADGYLQLNAGASVNLIDADGSLAGNTDASLPTQKAVKTYADTKAAAAAGSSDNAIARFDGTAGKTLQNSAVTIDDSGSVNIPSGQFYLKNSSDIIRYAVPSCGMMVNGKIVTSVASNNLIVAIKTLAGNDPSASDPVYVMIGDTIRSITAALSKTVNAGANTFNSGASNLATKETDYFVYLGYNATDGVTLGFARIPYGRVYSDFSATATAETYCAISTITHATAGDYYDVVGRFNAILSASANYYWSIPAASIIINKPIFETRWLDTVPAFTCSGSMTFTATSADHYRYQVAGRNVKIDYRTTGTIGGTASTDVYATGPFNAVYLSAMAGLSKDSGNAAPGIVYTAAGSNLLALRIYSGGSWSTGTTRIGNWGVGEYAIV